MYSGAVHAKQSTIHPTYKKLKVKVKSSIKEKERNYPQCQGRKALTLGKIALEKRVHFIP
jgi:hypothetical protein